MFGISQLHQLRGRVGRGKDQGYCYFIHSDDAKDETVEKLKYLECNFHGNWEEEIVKQHIDNNYVIYFCDHYH